MKRIITILFLYGLLCGCIQNDIPYPVIAANITQLDVEKALSVDIDPEERLVSIVLDETADIHNVKVNNISFNDELVKASWDLVGTRDLSKRLKMTLSTYSDYVWEISTSQPVERYFSISNQVGECGIDDVNHRVFATVSASADLSNLSINSIKLGPKDICQISPDPASICNFTEEQTLTVKYRDVTETWTVYVEQTETSIQFKSIDAWTGVAWLKANGIAGSENGFRYRQKGDEDWIEVENVADEGGIFSAGVNGLKADTDYECYAYSGKEQTSIESFHTEIAATIPNGGFETYSHAESDKYFSFYDPSSPMASLQNKWWGSGNKGSTTVGSSYAITKPEKSDKVEGNSSVLLESSYVVIKFAAGNIFSGEYYKTIGTSGGVIRAGRPFTQRPQKLVVWLKYTGGIITEKTLNDMPANDPVKVGDRDRGIVWVALGNWDYRKYGGTPECPLEFDTTNKSSLFNKNGENVIGYGEFVAKQDINEWTKIEIPINYVSTSRKPTHIVISAASSMLGDYFTGSADSKMWLDDVKLEY